MVRTRRMYSRDFKLQVVKELEGTKTLAQIVREYEIEQSVGGIQYGAKEYTDLLKSYGIMISMARKGNPYDNAKAESFIKTLKHEEVYLCDYRNIHEAQKRIDYFIGEVYNEDRLHSSLGYLPPSEFEEKILAAGKA